jgi:uncharacterized membrane protein
MRQKLFSAAVVLALAACTEAVPTAPTTTAHDLVSGTAASCPPVIRSSVVELPRLDGYYSATADAIDEAGVIDGVSFTDLPPPSKPPRATRWSASTLSFLPPPPPGPPIPPPPGWDYVNLSGGNSSGVVVGAAIRDGYQSPFIGTAAGSQLLPLPFGYVSGYAVAINESDVSVGYSDTIGTGTLKPLLWTASGVVEKLPLPARYGRGLARAISNTGEVVGSAGILGDVGGDRAGWRWTRSGGVHEIPPLPRAETGPLVTVQPNAVNERGQIVGQSGGGGKGFLYNPTGGVMALADLPGASQMVPSALNNRGQVVGYVLGFNGLGQILPVLWTVTGSPSAYVQEIADSVAALGERGRLTDGQVASLTNELMIVKRELDRDLHVSPTYVLRGVARHFEGIVRNGRLTDGTGRQLIDRVNCLITFINTF